MILMVTGGAGYIGSHTVKELLKKKYEVVILDNFSTGHQELVCGGRVIKADLRSKPEVKKAFQEFKVEAVLHFASLIQVGESYANPQKYYQHNLLSSLNLLEVMLEFGVK
ncbi:MAG: NAD-dependent epimerase/dehydratase family protein, partial [Candidatus Saccharicenans sp.]